MDLTPSSKRAPAALVSLLQMIEGPAALLDGSGRVLGANEELLGLARSLDVALVESVPDLVPGFGPGDLPDSAHVVVGRSLSLQGGEEREAQLMRLEGLSQDPLVILLLDAGEGEGVTPAAGLRASRLRHDLAGPLTAILGTAELLMMREQGLDEETREALDEILAQCSRISELISRDRTENSDPERETQ